MSNTDEFAVGVAEGVADSEVGVLDAVDPVADEATCRFRRLSWNLRASGLNFPALVPNLTVIESYASFHPTGLAESTAIGKSKSYKTAETLIPSISFIMKEEEKKT